MRVAITMKHAATASWVAALSVDGVREIDARVPSGPQAGMPSLYVIQPL